MRTIFAMTAMLMVSAAAQAQDNWPQRAVTLVVPFGAGGSADLTARIISTHLQTRFGSPFVIDNKGGAGGSIGAGFVAKAPNDGYTLLVGTVSSNAINAALYTRLAYDLDRDFQPVSLLVRFPNLLFVNPKIPAKIGDRADRLSQGQSRQGELRLVRHRHLVASLGGDVRARDRNRDDAHSVPQHRRSREQHDRRPYRSRHRQHDDHVPACAVGRGAGAGGDDAAAQCLDARSPHHRGDAAGLRGDRMAGTLCPRRHATADRRPARRGGETHSRNARRGRFAQGRRRRTGAAAARRVRGVCPRPSARSGKRWCGFRGRASIEGGHRHMGANLS